MIDWIIRFSVETMTFNSIFGICLYWLPFTLCIFGYTLRTARNVQKDKQKRSEAEKSNSIYRPTDTIGSLIGRALISIIPIANLWAAIFDISPVLVAKLFDWIGKTFDQPLVPTRK